MGRGAEHGWGERKDTEDSGDEGRVNGGEEVAGIILKIRLDPGEFVGTRIPTVIHL